MNQAFSIDGLSDTLYDKIWFDQNSSNVVPEMTQRLQALHFRSRTLRTRKIQHGRGALQRLIDRNLYTGL